MTRQRHAVVLRPRFSWCALLSRKAALRVAAVVLALGATGLYAQAPYEVVEAERCQVAAKQAATSGFIWASGNGQVHEFWGEKPGDTIAFDKQVSPSESKLRLAVRYSYNMHHYLGFRGRPASVEGIELVVDNAPAIPLTMPDTGDWHIYKCVVAELPALAPGNHHFVLRSKAEGSVRNIDCFIFFHGDGSSIPAWLRSSVVRQDAKGKILVLATQDVDQPQRIEAFAQALERVYGSFAAYFGNDAKGQLRVHVIADARWDNPGASAYQNNAGVFFKASTFDRDTGNVFHEMTHLFHVGRIPGWLDEPLAQAMTCFVWFPKLAPWQDPVLARRTQEGRQLASNPSTPLPNADALLSVLFAQYGQDLFSRFWGEVRKAEQAGKIAAGAPLTKQNVVECLSAAAGADVTPLFQRWPEFAKVQ